MKLYTSFTVLIVLSLKVGHVQHGNILLIGTEQHKWTLVCLMTGYNFSEVNILLNLYGSVLDLPVAMLKILKGLGLVLKLRTIFSNTCRDIY